MFKSNEYRGPIMKFKNGEIVATAKDDKVIVMDDELTIKQQFNGYNKEPKAIDFDDNNIIVGYANGMVHLYNRRSNERKEVIINFEINLISVQINQHNRSVWSVSLNQDYGVSAGSDNTIQVYSLAKMKTVHTFNHSDYVFCVSFGPVKTDYANKILSISDDSTVRIWNIENGKMEKEFKHGGWCISFEIDKDAATLAVACGNGGWNGISVWSIRDQKQIAKIKTASYALDVGFNRYDNEIAVGCGGGEIYKISL